MADPAYFGSASVPADNGSNATSTLTITPPGSMVAGDLVIVHASSRTTGTWSVGVTGGQTWNSVATITNDRLFWCVFNGTWSADPRFDCTASTCTTAKMDVFTGSATSWDWEVDVSVSTAGATAPVSDCPVTGITTITAKAVAYAAWTVRAAQTWGSLTGTGWVVAGDAQYRNTAQSGNSISHAYKLMPSAGATGDVQKTKSSTSSRYDAFIVAWRNVPPAYDIVGDAGSYAQTGTAATPKSSRIATAGTGSYAQTGTAATLKVGRKVTADTATYAQTGTAATLAKGNRLDAEAATYAQTGTDITLNRGQLIAADAGSYALTGQTAELIQFDAGAFGLAGDAGTYAHSGDDAALKSTRVAVAGADTYLMSGTAAGVLVTRVISAEAGIYEWSGTDIALRRGFLMPTDEGPYSHVGEVATLVIGKFIVAESAAYDWIGGDVDLTAELWPPNPDRFRLPGHWIEERRFFQGGPPNRGNMRK